jgi:hypothetical protein
LSILAPKLALHRDAGNPIFRGLESGRETAMMRMRRSAAIWLIALGLGLNAPAGATAQTNLPTMSVNPTAPSPAPPSTEPLPADFQTGVSFLDSALPRSLVRLRYDYDLFDRRPTRAEFLFPADGFHLPETRVHSQELNVHVEYGLNDWFSTFIESPYKWINPDQNDNVSGIGDLQFGAKFAGYNTENLLAAFYLNFGAHTSQHVLTGTGHWSVEPGLLANYRILDFLTLEGQVGYWVPIGGTDFAGNVLKYGLGLSYGTSNSTAIGLMPVAEIVGWTVTSGKEMVVPAPGVFSIEGASGDTIINGCVGLRFTLGQAADVYAGYSRCITGQPWFRDMIRVEFRLFY